MVAKKTDEGKAAFGCLSDALAPVEGKLEQEAVETIDADLGELADLIRQEVKDR